MTKSSQETSAIGLVRRWIPVLWIALSVIWATVSFVTAQLALPIAIWIVTALAPLTALQANANKARPTD
ncbi:MAG: hypothetical protein GXP35_09355 [Actinobacteria bacterium]|nr:hypothetical protein [Actinomycetota bacterium]